MTLAAFLAVAFLHLMAAISPGPAVLMAARTGVTEGLRTGFFLACGIGAGGVVWALAALFGLNLVFEAAPRAAVVAQDRGRAVSDLDGLSGCGGRRGRRSTCPLALRRVRRAAGCRHSALA
jgi:hypothetical protein